MQGSGYMLATSKVFLHWFMILLSKTVAKLLAYTKTLYSGLECSIPSLIKEEGVCVCVGNGFMVIMASAFCYHEAANNQRKREQVYFQQVEFKM